MEKQGGGGGMDSRMKSELDKWITGNWGEDRYSLEDDLEDWEDFVEWEVKKLMKARKKVENNEMA